jgi:hypothetical protein
MRRSVCLIKRSGRALRAGETAQMQGLVDREIVTGPNSPPCSKAIGMGIAEALHGCMESPTHTTWDLCLSNHCLCTRVQYFNNIGCM